MTDLPPSDWHHDPHYQAGGGYRDALVHDEQMRAWDQQRRDREFDHTPVGEPCVLCSRLYRVGRARCGRCGHWRRPS